VILVDTSVWIDHLRSGDPHLAELLDHDVVASHEFVIGEIACGNLKNRQEVLSLLSWLPKCEPATHEEVLFFIDQLDQKQSCLPRSGDQPKGTDPQGLVPRHKTTTIMPMAKVARV